MGIPRELAYKVKLTRRFFISITVLFRFCAIEKKKYFKIFVLNITDKKVIGANVDWSSKNGFGNRTSPRSIER